MAKSRLQNRIDLLGPKEGKVARTTLPSTGIPGVQANQQPIPGADQKPSNMLGHPHNALTLQTPDTSKYPYGDGNTPPTNPGATILPEKVAHSGLPGPNPLGTGKNARPYGMTAIAPPQQLEAVAGNRVGEFNKATNPYLGITGMPAPITGNMAMMEGGTNQPANPLGFTGNAQNPPGSIRKKIAKTTPKNKKGGIA